MEKPNYTMEYAKLTQKPQIIIKNGTKSAEMISKKKAVLWDCDSSLYDSFELKSFEKQLNAAISSASRSLSMPHLSSNRVSPNSTSNPHQPQLNSNTTTNNNNSNNMKPSSRFSRSLNKLIKTVFRPKSSNVHNSNNTNYDGVINRKRFNNYVVYDERPAGSLSTIPESPEYFDHHGMILSSPDHDLRSISRRTASDRFDVSRTTVGIYCS